jgi:hypothetical protein
VIDVRYAMPLKVLLEKDTARERVRRLDSNTIWLPPSEIPGHEHPGSVSRESRSGAVVESLPLQPTEPGALHGGQGRVIRACERLVLPDRSGRRAAQRC